MRAITAIGGIRPRGHLVWRLRPPDPASDPGTTIAVVVGATGRAAEPQ